MKINHWDKGKKNKKKLIYSNILSTNTNFPEWLLYWREFN